MACRLFAANLRQAIVWTNQANVDLLLIILNKFQQNTKIFI